MSLTALFVKVPTIVTVSIALETAAGAGVGARG
jgi:hypothetical protein